MRKGIQSRPDLVLLLSLIAVILLHPVLDHGDVRRMVLGGLVFVPVVLSTVRLAQLKLWLWPSLLLATAVLLFTIANDFAPKPEIACIKHGLLAVYFGYTAAGLFSYIRTARLITNSHLYTAISIYLLLAMLWASLYGAYSRLNPESIVSSRGLAIRQSDFLYFSLVTLTTVGYGDIVALDNEVQMLAGLEAITGVLYVAITVATLVGSYRPGSSGVAPKLPPTDGAKDQS